MKILVLGGAGYIGAHTVLELLDSGHSVVIFDNFSSGEILNVDKRSLIVEGDILSKGDLKKVFESHQFDAVMHFSALKAPAESMVHPEIYSETNIIGTLNVLSQMLKSKVYKFIFSSSSSVYGEPVNKKIDEDHPLKPLSFYGFTKLEIERLLIWYSKITKLRFVSLRYFNAAGYDLKSRIKIPENDAPNLIPKIMNVLSRKDKKLKVYGSNYNTKDGTCIRDYIHVTDLARAHINSLNYLTENIKPLFLNLATGNGHSVLDVIREVERQLGIKVPFEFTKRRQGDPSKVVSKSKYHKSPIKWKTINSNLKTIISSVLLIYKLKG